MQNLKVWTFHPTARNSLLFMVLSLFFLILQKSLQSSLPFLNVVFLKKSLIDEWPVLIAGIPAALLIYRHQASSRHAFALFCAVVTFRSLEGLFLDFNKVLMIVLFLYVCLSYAFYQLLLWTFSRAVFSPNYASDALYEPMSRKIEVVLSAGERRWSGYLTNWDHEGAFVYLSEAWPESVKGAELDLELEGHHFGAKGSVVAVTLDGRGIGLEWSKDKMPERLPWSSLIDLFDDLGWLPPLLR